MRMRTDLRRWLLPTLALCTAGMLVAAPLAWADDDHGGGGHDRDDHDRVPAQVVDQDEHENEVEVENARPVEVQGVEVEHHEDVNEDRDEHAGVADRDDDEAAVSLATMVGNEVALLNNVAAGEDRDEGVEFEDVNVTSLTSFTAANGLTSAQATDLTNALNANLTPLRNFLNSNSPTAMAFNNLLTSLGVNVNNVLGVVPNGEEGLTIITTG